MIRTALQNFPTPFTLTYSYLANIILLDRPGKSNAIFTHITFDGTGHNYMVLTPFETLFMCFFIIQISTLQMFGIFPINLNKLIHGKPSGRRKRGSERQLEGLFDVVLKTVHTLDKNSCVPRALCELQKHVSLEQFECPIGLRQVLRRLSRFKEGEKQKWENPVYENRDKFKKYYAEAVQIGRADAIQNFQFYSNSSTLGKQCELKYPTCPLSTNDVLTYIYQMKFDDFIY